MALSLDLDKRVAAAGWRRTGPLVGNTNQPFLAVHLVCGTEASVRLGLLEAPRKGDSQGCKACATKGRHLSEEVVDSRLVGTGWVRTGSITRMDEPFLARHLNCGTEQLKYLYHITEDRGFSGCKFCSPHGSQLVDVELKRRFKLMGWECLEIPRVKEQAIQGKHRCGHQQLVSLTNVERLESQGCTSCTSKKRSLSDSEIEDWLTIWKWKRLEPGLTHDILPYLHLVCDTVHKTSFNDLQTAQSRGRGGCPSCATSGFDVHRPGYLYLIEFPGFHAFKIGKSQNIQQRLKFFANERETIVHRVIGPLDGQLVSDVESKIIAQWRDARHLHVPELKGEQGWTETVSSLEVTLEEVLCELKLLFPSISSPILLSNLRCGQVNIKEARDFVVLNHYTHTCPSALFYSGLWHEEMLVGVAVFGRSSYPGAGRFGWGSVEPGPTLELRRFVLVDFLPKNTGTWFLSRSIESLPSSYEMIISFADPAAGHTGGLYRAANFVFLGEEAVGSYHYDDKMGNHIHKRTVWTRAKTQGLTEKALVDKEGLMYIADPPKFRFAFPRSDRARKILHQVKSEMEFHPSDK